MDLMHLGLGALVVTEIAITIIGLAELRRRSEKHEGIQAATFLALRRLDEFVRNSRPSSPR